MRVYYIQLSEPSFIQQSNTLLDIETETVLNRWPVKG